MAAFHGKGGSVTLATNAQANVVSWSIDATCDMAEITDMGDSVKTYVAGFPDWTASVEVEADSTGLLAGTTAVLTALGAAAALVLLTGQGTIYGNAFLSGFSVNTPADGIVMLTLNYQGSGALAVS